VRGQEYSWTFATPANFPQNATGTVTRLVLTVPPGTAGTPTVSSIGYTGSSSGSMTVTSAAISDSSLILNLATPATVPKSVSFTVVVDGLTNTGTGGVFNSSVSFQNGIANVVSGTGTTMWTFSPYVAGTSAVTWTPSSLVTGDAPVHFDYSATSPSQLLPGVKTMVVTLPTGTSGTPGSPINVTIGGSTVSATVGAITSNAVVLTLASTQDIAAGTHLAFSLTGLTNTAASGTYASNVVLYDDASFQLWEFDSVTKDFGEPGEDVPGTGDLDWALSSAVAGASGLSYTFTFTAATDADLTSLQLTLPSGTDASALTVSSISPAAITSVSAVAISNVLTLSWSPAVTVGPDSANPHTIVLTLNHVTNAEVGSYAPTMTTYDADGVVDTATADLTDLLAATFGISVACGTNANCATHGSDTEISIVALPGQSVVTVGGVDVTVTTNAPGGYLLRLLATALKKDDGVELHAGYDTNAYGFTGSMSSSRPGAQVCSPFNGASAAAYPLSSFLLAAAGTGTDGDGDTVTLDTQVQVSPLQPAGVYHGALSFLATPNFDQSAGSAC
jgi:hypothetical protein